MNYLQNIPEDNSFGLSKVLLVRRETIHLKHILTEVFLRQSKMKEILFDVFKDNDNYIVFMINRLRKIYNFSREYNILPQEVVNFRKDSFFRMIDFYCGLNNVIVLDFDGVVTKNSFKVLYDLCLQKGKVFICSANPDIKEKWFLDRGYDLPAKIFSCKGKIAKKKKLVEISKLYDNVFYIDNEEHYLQFAYCIGVHPFIYINNKIKYKSFNSK